ncbi:unknown protein [Seminavis robusta]|uniref:Uncharacterized protein n=1 Tax=Seminavis robusta TaxID=568900 RepID=A0A9N8HHF1_9STRA|nr:unknown protein [Seminavis robusta]|eukprot:Sro445_g144470.1 n/a (485) ;mRNA; r:12411-13865
MTAHKLEKGLKKGNNWTKAHNGKMVSTCRRGFAVPILIFITSSVYYWQGKLGVYFQQGQPSYTQVKANATFSNGSKAHSSGDSNSTFSKEERVAAFYQHHYEQMKALVNFSSVLRWHDGGSFNTWIQEFKVVTIEDETTNLEEANLHNHSFVFAKEASLCTVAKVFDKFHQNNSQVSWPHVALIRFHNDFGALSSPLRGHTASLKLGPHFWEEREGCSREFVLKYINHPDTLAIFTSQFQIFRHEKVFSLPLGLPRYGGNRMWSIIEAYHPSKTNRSEVLMLNAKPWRQRTGPMKQILQNFNASSAIIQNSITEKTSYEALTMEKAAEMTKPNDNNTETIQNTYQIFQSVKGSKNWHPAMHLYYNQMMRSRFVWSPSGLGLDCYRHWEAMYLGTFPVIAHLGRMEVDGWMSDTMRDLPVVWVEQYDQVTPEFLEQAFDRIVFEPPAGGYRYEKLTKQYWINKAYSFLKPHSPGVGQTTTTNSHG